MSYSGIINDDIVNETCKSLSVWGFQAEYKRLHAHILDIN